MSHVLCSQHLAGKVLSFARSGLGSEAGSTWLTAMINSNSVGLRVYKVMLISSLAPDHCWNPEVWAEAQDLWLSFQED